MGLLPNWTGWKTLKVLLTGIAAACLSLAASAVLPADFRALATLVGQLDAALLAVVIFLSGTAAGPPVAKTEEAKAAVARSIMPPPVPK